MQAAEIQRRIVAAQAWTGLLDFVFAGNSGEAEGEAARMLDLLVKVNMQEAWFSALVERFRAHFSEELPGFLAELARLVPSLSNPKAPADASSRGADDSEEEDEDEPEEEEEEGPTRSQVSAMRDFLAQLRALNSAFSRLHERIAVVLSLGSGFKSLKPEDSELFFRSELFFTLLSKPGAQDLVHESVKAALRLSFLHFQASGEDASESFESSDDEDKEEEEEEEASPFRELPGLLRALGWTEEIAKPLLENLLAERVRARLRAECADVFDEPKLAGCRNWSRQLVLGFLGPLLGFADQTQDSGSPGSARAERAERESWIRAAERLVLEAFCELRVTELFDLIVEFPESKPCIADLKLALREAGALHLAGEALREASQRRLCHAGANTADILNQLVSTVRVLHELDPEGGLLRQSCGPVVRYLAGRPDALSCFVHGIIGQEECADLLQELQSGPRSQLRSPESEEPLVWVPTRTEAAEHARVWDDKEGALAAPLQALLGSGSLRSLASPELSGTISPFGAKPDVIGKLMRALGDRERVMKEYRRILSFKLLSQLDYDTEVDAGHIELFKLRFGEQGSATQQLCEVMIGDVFNSKRDNNNVYEMARRDDRKRPDSEDEAEDEEGAPLCALRRLSRQRILEALILSDEFWPQPEGTQDSGLFKLPSRLLSVLGEYEALFTRLKAPRVLRWQHQLGRVELELSFADGRELCVTASPLQASVIDRFHSEDEKEAEEDGDKRQARWTLSELAEELEMEDETDELRRALRFWVKQRVLIVVKGAEPCWEVLEELPAEEGDLAGMQVDSEGEEDEEEGSSGDNAEELKIFILGILGSSGFKAVPLSSVSNMLKMWAQSGAFAYSKTDAELQILLEDMVLAGTVDKVDGKYRRRSDQPQPANQAASGGISDSEEE